MKTYVRKRRIQMFIAAFTLNSEKFKKQPTRTSTGEWVSKLWHIHGIEYTSQQKNEQTSDTVI